MQSSIVWLVLTTVVYFSGSFTAVYARCSGRWAIHACYGGNGKRSSPLTSPTDTRSPDRQFVLRQLLLSDTLPAVTEDEPLTSLHSNANIEDEYSEVGGDRRIKELDWMQNILTRLLQEERVRTSKSNEMDFRR